MKKEGAISFTVVERTEQRVVSEMPVTAGVKNPYGVVQAGAMLWLADVTATILVLGSEAPAEGAKGFPLAINLNAAFVGNSREGTIKAVATFVKKGRSVSVVRTEVTGDDGKLFADVTTTHVLSR